MKYDFKDLMSFGMFILALLTLIVLISQQRFSVFADRKTTLVYLTGREGGVSIVFNWSTLVGGCFPFYVYNIAYFVILFKQITKK